MRKDLLRMDQTLARRRIDRIDEFGFLIGSGDVLPEAPVLAW